jgi:hypothetical protein
MRSPDETLELELPTVQLTAPDVQLQVIRRLQAFVLKHPVAAKAAFSALVEEGLAFAKTPEGKMWREKLADSDLLHRARLVLDLPGLALLERQTETAYPSAYLDAIFMLASALRPDGLMEPLLDWEVDRHDG